MQESTGATFQEEGASITKALGWNSRHVFEKQRGSWWD